MKRFQQLFGTLLGAKLQNKQNIAIAQSLRSIETLQPLCKVDDYVPQYMHLSPLLAESGTFKEPLVRSMIVFDGFLSEQDEANILQEIEPNLKRMRYEFDHWDNAIHGYRETERLAWNAENQKTLNRVRTTAFPANINPLKYVHILDLDAKGYIKPHIDAVRFCGDTIAGLSLLSDSVMRLVHAERKTIFADVLLKRRSLYIMKDTARYDYTHEILPNETSTFRSAEVRKTRRISVICRNEPTSEEANK